MKNVTEMIDSRIIWHFWTHFIVMQPEYQRGSNYEWLREHEHEHEQTQ